MDSLKIKHVYHCIDYKKIIFRCIFSTLNLPFELEKYLFTFIGFGPFPNDELTLYATLQK